MVRLTSILKISILFLLLASDCYSQSDSSDSKYGIFGGVNINIHQADFKNLPGIPNCCPRFEEGTGIGYNFGILYEQSIANRIRIGARLGLQTFDATLKRDEETTLVTSNGAITGIFEHKVESKFMNIGLEPMIIFNFFNNFHFNLGARLGQNITKEFSQVETITKPDGVGTFLDSAGNDSGKRTRNEYSGTLIDAIDMQFGLVTGIHYELPLNKDNSMRLTPEIFYYYGLSDMVENTNWSVSSIRVSLAVKYAPIEESEINEIYRKEYKIDTIRIDTDLLTNELFKTGIENSKSFTDKVNNDIITTEIFTRTDTLFKQKKYKLDGDITAVGIDKDGNEITNPVFIIEEFVSNRLDPLLNYIFFEDNSSTLPGRYIKLNKEQVDKFKLTDLIRDSTIKIYYNILNILGERLRKFPQSKLTLIGCNSDFDNEKNNLELSHKRADIIKEYLVNVWGIEGKRIITEARNLPLKASTPKIEPDKIAENRRVEIYSDDYRILEPIFIEKVDRTANPPVIRFKPIAESDAGIKKWEINAFQNTDIANNFKMEKSGNQLSNIDWKLEQNQEIIPKLPEALQYNLSLEDTKGNVKKLESKSLDIKLISVQEKRRELKGDYEIEKFSIILFEFDQSSIDETNKKIIDFIKGRISPNSEIEITGYTDRTGNPDYNQKLSEQRANTVKSALNRKDATAIGTGQNELLYSNDTPEGRFYCRTVNILVKTKVK
jgi:outer membrane protein OmpA-like peptidoglycan-associated protein